MPLFILAWFTAGIWREAPRFLWKQNGTVKHAFSGWSHFDENSGHLWNTDNQGRARGSLGLHLTTRELAQFVQLYLQQGRWHGQQLIPADFVAASTVAQSRGEQPEKTRYGYLWWITVDQAGRQAYFAGGFGGQYVYIVPEQSIVIAITSSSRRGNGQTHRRTICPWISEAIDRVESTQN